MRKLSVSFPNISLYLERLTSIIYSYRNIVGDQMSTTWIHSMHGVIEIPTEKFEEMKYRLGERRALLHFENEYGFDPTIRLIEPFMN